MSRGTTFLLLMVASLVMEPASARALPITLQASGQISSQIDPLGVLSGALAGTPWSLDVTVELDTPGILNGGCCTPSYLYAGALGVTQFQLGDHAYSNTVGDVFTNADLPVIGCSSALGGPGL